MWDSLRNLTMHYRRPWHNAPHFGSPLTASPPANVFGVERMVLAIRDVREHDLDAVLALNNAAEGGISPMDGEELRHFFHMADYFRVAEVDGHLAGFLIALRERADHPGHNFLWFKQDRKSTRLNSSHVASSYAVFCLKKKKKNTVA